MLEMPLWKMMILPKWDSSNSITRGDNCMHIGVSIVFCLKIFNFLFYIGGQEALDDFERAWLGYNGATVDFLIWLLDALNLESSLVASGMLGIINDDAT